MYPVGIWAPVPSVTNTVSRKVYKRNQLAEKDLVSEVLRIGLVTSSMPSSDMEMMETVVLGCVESL